jgi:hypothetical protein
LREHLAEVDGDTSDEIVRAVVLVVALRGAQSNTRLAAATAITHQNLNPVVALDNLKHVSFVPSGIFAAFLMSLGSPFGAGHCGCLQQQNAVRIVFAKEIDCDRGG